MFWFATAFCVVLACLPQAWATRRYFIANALVTPIEVLSVGGPTYTRAYVVCDALVLIQCFLLVWAVLADRQYRLRLLAIPIPLALALGKMAWMDAHRHLNADDWVSIARGCLLLWLGVVLGWAAHRQRLRGSCAALGVLWVAQGTFSLGHVSHLGSSTWLWWDWHFQGLVAIIAWTLVGCGLIRAHYSVGSRLSHTAFTPPSLNR